MIREPLEGLLLQHGCATRDLVFQCDADCRDFANDHGRHLENRSPAHSLAGILAWGNSRGREPKSTVSLDISDRHEEQTLRRFKYWPRIHINPRSSPTHCVSPRDSHTG